MAPDIGAHVLLRGIQAVPEIPRRKAEGPPLSAFEPVFRVPREIGALYFLLAEVNEVRRILRIGSLLEAQADLECLILEPPAWRRELEDDARLSSAMPRNDSSFDPELPAAPGRLSRALPQATGVGPA